MTIIAAFLKKYSLALMLTAGGAVIAASSFSAAVWYERHQSAALPAQETNIAEVSTILPRASFAGAPAIEEGTSISLLYHTTPSRFLIP